jgi:CubicO group peptidase (beta-lactamase class C family)
MIDVADPARRALCLLAAGAVWSRAHAAAALDAQVLAELDRCVAAACATDHPPGAVVWVEHAGAVHERAFGRRALVPAEEPNDATTVYDIASLTKVVATTPLLMRLVESGRVEVDTPVRRLLAGFEAGDAITLRHLLTHTSGLPADLPLDQPWQGTAAAFALAQRARPTQAPGTRFRYSDINFILLAEIVQQLAGRPLASLAQEQIFGPLKMHDTGFLPLARGVPLERIAPTEVVDGRPLRGVVHDPTARRMGGVAGHAGVFATAADLARYARCLMAGGELDGARILRPETVAQMSAVATPPTLAARRGLGWDIDSPFSRARGSVFPIGSYGHTGFTGCALWISPASQAFYVLLTNRVHPHAGASIVPLYASVGTLAGRAAGA